MLNGARRGCPKNKAKELAQESLTSPFLNISASASSRVYICTRIRGHVVRPQTSRILCACLKGRMNGPHLRARGETQVLLLDISY